MGAIIPLLECLLTLLVVALGIAAVLWVLGICIKAIGGEGPPANLMMILYAIGVLVLIIVAVECLIGGSGHALIHLQ